MKNERKLLTLIRKENDLKGSAFISDLSIKDANVMAHLVERGLITAKQDNHDQGSIFSNVKITYAGINYLDGTSKSTSSVWDNIDRRLFVIGVILIPLTGIIITLI
jgi:hypothetical protein